MYCKKCGNPIDETDIRCKICGALLGGDSSETVRPGDKEGAGGSPTGGDGGEESVHFSEFTWNVHDFPKPKKTEDLNLRWTPSESESEKETPVESSLTEAESEHKSSKVCVEQVDEEQDVRPVPLARPYTPEKKSEAEAVLEESVKEIEKFFTFTKKNEEFQRLLDREYEKLKSQKDGKPYAEPELGVLMEEPQLHGEPEILGEHSALERMIMEGTTPVEEAAPIEDLLHRRTIPVDLEKIQREARRAEELREAESLDEEKKRKGEEQPKDGQQAEADANRPEPVEKEECVKAGPEEIPSIELPKKSVEDIITEYKTAAGISDDPKAENDQERQRIAGEMDQLSEMAAARESFYRQMNEEREALRKAEEEAALRSKLEEEMKAAGRRSEPATISQTLTGANAEIQVTVAVKANGGMTPAQEAISVVHTTPAAAAEPYRAEPAVPFRNANLDVGERAGREPEHEAVHVIDAEVTSVRENTMPSRMERIAKETRGESATAFHQRPDGKMPAGGLTGSADAAAAGAAEALSYEPWHENTLNNLFSVGFQQEEEEEEKKGGCAVKVILTLLVILLLIEITFLGIKYFVPDSAAAGVVSGMEVKIVEVFNGAVDGVKDFFNGLSGGEKDPASGGNETGSGSANDQEETENNGQESGDGNGGVQGSGSGHKPEPPNPEPMADKTALIATQLSKNKNIKEITASDELKYKEGRSYKISDINKSKPIENNIWKVLESGEAVYYDQAIVGTLIAFDSQWQDYVNSQNGDVFNLVKEGSKAYQYASEYSQVGKEKQSFETLQIGEIRQGEKGFYVWTKEQIKKTKNGKTDIKTLYWIYQLEPVGDSMKIVNYIAY